RHPEAPRARGAHRAAEGGTRGVPRALHGDRRRLRRTGDHAAAGPLMRPVLTAEAMRRVDARAIAELGIPGPTLMENAGRGAADALIGAINASGRPVVALDVPSGLPADGGRAEGPVVRAWLTPTFAAPKLGLVVGDGADLAGRVVVVPIGVPEAEVARDAQTFLLE